MLLRNNKLSTALKIGTTTFALIFTVGVASSFASPKVSSAKVAITNVTTTNTVTPGFTAADDNGNDFVLASFRKEFRNADVMQVENKKDYTKLTFRMNGVIMFAYYSDKGELIAIVRNILSTQLPIRLLMDLKQQHSDSWITDLFEMDSNGQTVYYVTLENSDTKVTLRSDNTTSWTTYAKENKENAHL